MDKTKLFFTALTALFSLVVLLGLPLATWDRLGASSLLYAIVAAAFIWLLYFIWGTAFSSEYKRGYEQGRKDEREGH